MDAVVVGLLTALTLALGSALWTLLVHPDVLLARWSRGGMTQEGWFEEHPAALSALRWVLGGVLFLFGFLTGLVTAFLSRTG